MSRFVPAPVKRLLRKLQFQGGSMRSSQHNAGAAATNPDDKRPFYRYPTAGSREHPVIPHGPLERDYDIKYFPRDTRRADWHDKVAAPENTFGDKLINATRGAILVDDPVKSSPGNGNPDVMRYDPSGLRSAMTATHEAMDVEMQKHRPTQLCTFEWEDYADEVIESYEAHGIPPVPGRRCRGLDTNARRFDNPW